MVDDFLHFFEWKKLLNVDRVRQGTVEFCIYLLRILLVCNCVKPVVFSLAKNAIFSKTSACVPKNKV